MEDIAKIFKNFFYYYKIDALTFSVAMGKDYVSDFRIHIQPVVIEEVRYILEDVGNKVEKILNDNFKTILETFGVKSDSIFFIDKTGTYLHRNVDAILLQDGNKGELIKWKI